MAHTLGLGLGLGLELGLGHAHHHSYANDMRSGVGPTILHYYLYSRPRRIVTNLFSCALEAYLLKPCANSILLHLLRLYVATAARGCGEVAELAAARKCQ